MIKIITDTTSCLPREVAERYGIAIVPQLIHFGDQTFREGEDISLEEFIRKLKESRGLPKTSAPPPSLFRPYFEKWVAEGHTIFCIHPSTALSGTVRSATVAAEDFPNADIRIIDTRLIAAPLGKVVELAAHWAEAGEDADTIQSRVMNLARRNRLYFLVDTLEYLARGGRIGRASQMLGTMLRIKPILTLDNGVVVPFQKERTLRFAIKRLVELAAKGYPTHGEGYLQVLHAAAEERAAQLAEALKKALPQVKEIEISSLPPAIVTHTGPGTLGVSFFREDKSEE